VLNLLTAAVGMLGLVGLYRRLRAEFPASVGIVTVVLVLGATPLAWYALLEPALIEVIGFAIVAWLAAFAGSRSPSETSSRFRTVAVTAAALVPLFVGWLTLAPQSSIQPASARFPEALFSSWNGFLSWTPVVYLAAVGSVGYFRRDREWALATLLALIATAWLVGSADQWASVRTFGGRAMMPVLALLAPGLALVIESARKRPALALIPLVVAPLLWNHLLMVQYTVGMLPKDEPVSFARMVRQQADGYSRTWRVYPFAFPANVLFAWREGLPVDRYDTLALEPRVASLDLVMDRMAGRFLLEGWDGMTAEGEAPGWWIGGRTATLAVPLALPDGRPVRISVTARSRHEEPVVEADLALLINGKQLFEFTPSAAAASEAQFTLSPEAIENLQLFRDGFNRITFASRGQHRVDPTDTGRPGPLARRAGRPAWPVAVYRVTITAR
jgi:hypothetical protein